MTTGYRPSYLDFEFFPPNMSLGDMLQRLASISPDDIAAITILVEHTLRRRWVARLHRPRLH